jgi:hypothetical protein
MQMSRTSDDPSPRKYFDARESIDRRKYETIKRGEKSNRYETKKGYYWDKIMKEQSTKPPPSTAACYSDTYNLETSLINKSKSVQSKKIDRSLSRNSFIDEVIHNVKKYNLPAPNKYDLSVYSKLHQSVDMKDSRKRQHFH